MIKAIGDKIVVREMKRMKTAGGIILPETGQDPQCFGLVISIGEDVKNVSENNVVVFHQRGGMSMVLNKELLKVIKYDEIYGVLTDDEVIECLEVVKIG